MRVLHILEATGGGTARHVQDLCVGLARRGVDVHIVYSPLRADSVFLRGLPLLREAGVRLFEIPIRRVPYPDDLKVLLKLYRYLRQNGPVNVVHGHSSKGGALVRLLRLMGGPPAIYTPHAFVTLAPRPSQIERWVYGSAERVLRYFTSALIAVSKDEAREAQKLGFPPERIHLIPNGISLNDAYPVSREGIRLRLGLGEREVVIGFVGRLVPQKAPEFLLEAFAEVAPNFPETRLVMVGDGPLGPFLKKRVRELSLDDRVLLPGFMEGRTVLPAFDIFALPSAYEGFPYVLLEALAAGLPVVATRVGGTEMAIDEGENGFLVPVGDVKGFAKGLARLLGDEALRKSFGQRSLDRVLDFSVDNMVKKTLALYQEVAK